MADLRPIDVQIASLINKLHDISRKELPRAQARALNRTLDAGTTAAIRQVSRAEAVQQKLVRGRTFKKRANVNRLVASVRMYHRGVPAIYLTGVRDKGRYRKGRRGKVGSGVSARGGHGWAGGFIATGKGGKRHVFESDSKGRNLEVIKIDVRTAFNNAINPALRREMNTNYARRLRAELDYRLTRYRA